MYTICEPLCRLLLSWNKHWILTRSLSGFIWDGLKCQFWPIKWCVLVTQSLKKLLGLHNYCAPQFLKICDPCFFLKWIFTQEWPRKWKHLHNPWHCVPLFPLRNTSVHYVFNMVNFKAYFKWVIQRDIARESTSDLCSISQPKYDLNAACQSTCFRIKIWLWCDINRQPPGGEREGEGKWGSLILYHRESTILYDFTYSYKPIAKYFYLKMFP